MAGGKSVFISYCSKDQKYVKKMTQMLDKMGISYWIAPDMIPAGSNYAREIPYAIRNCEVFLLVLSEASQNSIWVEKEIDSAIHYRKTIVPFQIDASEMSELFRFYLNNVQTIHCVNRPKQAIEELKGRLRLLVSEQNAADKAEDEPLPAKASKGKEDRPLPAKSSKGKEDKPLPAKASKDKEDGEPLPAKGSADKGDETAPKKRQARRRVSALDSRGIPIECEYCGGSLKKIGQGVFLCQSCKKENYDYFRTVRNYLREHGARPALVIERDTGVPRNIIEGLLTQEYLEIPKLETARLSCSRCGAPIRTGTLCDACKNPPRESSITKGAVWRSTRKSGK